MPLVSDNSLPPILMTLSREHLQNDYFKKLAEAQTDDGQPRPLTAEELAASMNATLANAPAPDHTWVFGYGSLVWNPLFEHDRNELTVLHGYRRSFCLKTQISRGTPELPGLLLGLEPGGSCRGVAYRMTGSKMHEELALLWRREMLTGAYCPRWVTLRMGTEKIRGLAFVMNRKYPFYAADHSNEETAQVIAHACGPLGSCAEYLFKTHAGLQARGIRDQHLEKLVARVLEIQQNDAAGLTAA